MPPRVVPRGRMGWAAGYIERLLRREAVSFRPRRGSMAGKVEPGQRCTVAPVDPADLEVGDVVLVRVGGREYLHLVRAIDGRGRPGARYQIGNTRGGINGWVTGRAIFGRLTRVEP